MGEPPVMCFSLQSWNIKIDQPDCWMLMKWQWLLVIGQPGGKLPVPSGSRIPFCQKNPPLCWKHLLPLKHKPLCSLTGSLLSAWVSSQDWDEICWEKTKQLELQWSFLKSLSIFWRVVAKSLSWKSSKLTWILSDRWSREKSTKETHWHKPSEITLMLILSVLGVLCMCP